MPTAQKTSIMQQIQRSNSLNLQSTTMHQTVPLLFITISLLFWVPVSGGKPGHNVTCDSCFAQCPEGAHEKPELCECDAGTFCHGDYCFAKIELWPDEKVASIQKGCISHTPGGKTGCFHAGSDYSIECYCDEPLCNRVAPLNGYKVKTLPTMECCECSELDDGHCNRNNCTRTCTGDYCLADFERQEQMCGMGYPRLWQFLRTKDYDEWRGGTTCARYESGHVRDTYGCTCTKPGACNIIDDLENHDKRLRMTRGLSGSTYCYTLATMQNTPKINQDVFDRADTCEGHFCFIEFSSVELVLNVLTDVPNVDIKDIYDSEHIHYETELRERYEVKAGCLTIDDESKVQTGCTSEYPSNDGVPWRKHCICAGHMCNYYYQLTHDDMSSLRAMVPPTRPLPPRPRLFSKALNRTSKTGRVQIHKLPAPRVPILPNDQWPRSRQPISDQPTTPTTTTVFRLPAPREPLKPVPTTTSKKPTTATTTTTRRTTTTTTPYPTTRRTTTTPTPLFVPRQEAEPDYQGQHGHPDSDYYYDPVRPQARSFVEEIDISIDTYDELPNRGIPPMIVSSAPVRWCGFSTSRFMVVGICVAVLRLLWLL